MQVQPYLFFNGNCEAALNFYKAQLGAEITFLTRFSDAPDPAMQADGDKIMHATFHIGQSVIMASDGECNGSAPAMQGFSLSIGTQNFAEGERLFNTLAEGGTVQMPYEKTFWAKGFGMVVDQFGTPWMVNCE